MLAGLTTRTFPLSASVSSCCLTRRGDALGLALTNGRLALFPADDTADAAKILPLYPPDIPFLLAPDADDHALLTGGSDGRLLIIDPSFDVPTEIAQAPARLDAIAGGAGGFRAYAAQNQIVLFAPEGDEIACFETGSPVHRLVFTPDGTRWVALTAQGFYTGPSTSAEKPAFIPAAGFRDMIALAGAPNLIALSDQGFAFYQDFFSQTPPHLVSAERSPFTLIATDLSSSFLLAGGGRGAAGFALSQEKPFVDRTLALGPSNVGAVTAVAAHPRDPFVTIGYQNGLVVFAPLDGRMEMTLRPAASGDSVQGLAWSAYGDCLFVAMASGQLLLYVARSRRAAT